MVMPASETPGYTVALGRRPRKQETGMTTFKNPHFSAANQSRCIRFHHPVHGNSRSVWVGIKGTDISVALDSQCHVMGWQEALQSLVLSQGTSTSVRLFGRCRRDTSPGDFAAIQLAVLWAVTAVAKRWVQPIVGHAEWSDVEPVSMRVRWTELEDPMLEGDEQPKLFDITE